LDADQFAIYEELDHALYEATSRFNLAEVNAQSVNAEELAKAKEAEREVVLEQRAEAEEARGDALKEKEFAKADLNEQKAVLNADIDELRTELTYTDDQDEINTLLDQIGAKKDSIKDLDQ
jgi:hypothetical protein